jgi:3D (Asp-Asp-Asp) domain-containing protein
MSKNIKNKLIKNIILLSFVGVVLVLLLGLGLLISHNSREEIEEKPKQSQHKVVAVTKPAVSERQLQVIKQVRHKQRLKKLSEEKRRVMKKVVVVSRSKQPEKWYKAKYNGQVTMYTAGYESTGKRPGDKGYGITASGKTAVEGTTIAMSKQFPFGTKVKIEGFPQTFTVQDRGGAIRNKSIDVYVTSLDRAINFGRQERTFYIIQWGRLDNEKFQIRYKRFSY